MNLISRIFNLSKNIFDKETRVVTLFIILKKQRLLTKHSLTPTSLVLDVGGYKGEFAQLISEKYNCFVEIYEPYEEFAKICEGKFGENSKINVNQVALFKSNGQKKFNIAENASGFEILQDNSGVIEVNARDIKDEFTKFTSIDLVKLNIEGAEFDLLERLIETNLLDKPKSYLIQFHNFYPDSAIRRNFIQENLRKFYKLDFCYEFVWEKWVKK
jgi:FkbM family methyltransferase